MNGRMETFQDVAGLTGQPLTIQKKVNRDASEGILPSVGDLLTSTPGSELVQNNATSNWNMRSIRPQATEKSNSVSSGY